MTALVHWRPLGDFADLHRRIDHLFDELIDGDGAKLAAVDVIREDDRILVRADMPGVKPEDLTGSAATRASTAHWCSRPTSTLSRSRRPARTG